MKKCLLVALLMISIPAQSAGVWDECESSFRAIVDESYKIVGMVDSAKLEELQKINPNVVLPKGAGCPNALYFEDMPMDLQIYITERLEGFEVKKEVIQGRRSSEALEKFRIVFQKNTAAKVRNTLSMKVTGAKEEVRQEKRQLKKELERKKR
jgi:hypothetical protein